MIAQAPWSASTATGRTPGGEERIAVTPESAQPDTAAWRRVTRDAQNRRWRRVFAALALLVPPVILGLFLRQEARLAALADHGRPADARVEHVSVSDGNRVYTNFAWVVDGEKHRGTAPQPAAPYPPGALFPITYLPEDPAVARPGAYDAAAFAAERRPPITFGVPAMLFVFFAASAAFCHRALRRSERGLAARRTIAD